ncbi:hypothetical protein [Sphingomonas sp. TZW2008]|uniref:hypothetical protein n=1 Tax=Sphingomonas sp. TZW2008 TaxID=1917973 RepID=UPI001181B254|nr:hypothetical protein [Sphingomonas sp. TZW2008]
MQQSVCHLPRLIVDRRDEMDVTQAKQLVVRAWPQIVAETREQLGGELHYQAVAYHCLRQAGVPARQMGMNVKQWIDAPISSLFQAWDQKKKEAFRGGFEPVPDIVLFKPEVAGNWQRRNAEATIANMLMAIEVKASERANGRLSVAEIVRDIAKLAAHREEIEHRGHAMTPVMMVIDVASDARERMRAKDVDYCAARAAEQQVGWMYVSPDADACVIH